MKKKIVKKKIVKPVKKKNKKIKKGRRTKNIIQRLQSSSNILTLNNQDTYFIEKNEKQEEIQFLKQNINNFEIDCTTQQLDIVKKIQCSIHLSNRIQNVENLYHSIILHMPSTIEIEQKINCFEMCQSLERCIFYYYHLDDSYKVFYDHSIQQIIYFLEHNGSYILHHMSFDQMIYFLANSLYYVQNTNQYKKYIKMLNDVAECKRSIDIETNDPFEDCKKTIRCRVCGHDKVKITILQERRSDEAATIMYQCVKDHTHLWKSRG